MMLKLRLKKIKVKDVRDGWDAAFKAMGEKNDDKPIIGDNISHSWDEEEWPW